ncbi:MAG TPA: hypothetical protein VHA80_09850 [Solirubrobacterales bacterium]|jgi:hypothetical protein|nr:hypothetical protein [Solirubrobacterales bacterium]
MEPGDAVAEAKGSGAPPRLRLVHDAEREREAQAIVLRLVLAERPSELRIEAVIARIGDVELAVRAITTLVEGGLLLKIDEYVMATAAAVSFHDINLAA